MSGKCGRFKKDLKTPCSMPATASADSKWKVPHCNYHTFYPPVTCENPHQCGATTTRGEPCKWAVPEKGIKCQFHSGSSSDPTSGAPAGDATSQPVVVVPEIKDVSSQPVVVVPEIKTAPVVVQETKAVETASKTDLKEVIRCGGKCSSKTSACRRIVNKVGDRCSLHLNQK